MENQINVGDQNTQQIGQNPVNQPVQIKEKPKVNYWMVSMLILTVLLLGVLGWYIFSAAYQTNQTGSGKLPKQPLLPSEFACSQNGDCVIGIQASSCCSCPKAINKNMIKTKGWDVYEFGKDYSSQQTKSCGGTVACKPCESPKTPICSNGQCQFPSDADRGSVDIRKQDVAVFLKLSQTGYEHDDSVFEPVKYSLVNNSSKPIYFLSGCGVVIPEVYKIQGSQRTKLQKSTIMCLALPEINQVTSRKSVELGWNQQNLGKFVEDGQYQLAVEYSFEKSGNYKIDSKPEAVSNVFSIKQVSWDLNKQKQICELYGSGFHGNDFFYSKKDCLERLNK
ncbi:hypothetical protein HY357_04320 [Candidatus Roizmanbacteria bacterium]|nr:hypothetical protein [Candidatus Roizmanbacteria bacterium]